ncbi:MAG: hypothetical protein FD169_1828 [Bacillota bacterium]|nr:MAG: hypothetical protein FD169_1828 [Bacillota bacterium]
MRYLSVSDLAKEWGVSERTVRNYCAQGKIPGTFLTGKTWNIPESAQRPERSNRRMNAPTTLSEVLQAEKAAKVSGGIYHKVQIELTYNSNRIEGSRLTREQTRFMYETNTISAGNQTVNVDDIVETANHFKCIAMIIDSANYGLSESFIKQLHAVLKKGTSGSRTDWFAVGDYKRIPNEVGGRETTAPEEVSAKMKELLSSYSAFKQKTWEEIIGFHYQFEAIHPFQDGNGRVGRLILFKECLRNSIVPFIIDEDLKMFYYRGLHDWTTESGYLIDTCLTAQDKFKTYLDYFRIPY